jgi:RNA polymerase sigma factor (sigma-70 family)
VIDATRRGAAPPEEPLELLYARLQPVLIRLANLITGSEAVAEDVVQDAFVGFARHAGRVENPDGYLRTAVVNGARTHFRRAKRGSLHRDDRVTVTGIPEIDETWTALRALPIRQRAAIVLRFYEDLPFDEVATVLQCRPSTARSLTRRGLARA